jgi:hypothetical protein
VWAGIAESEGLTLAVAADHQGNLKQHGLVQFIAVDAIGRQGAVPETVKHKGVGRLALRGFEFRHGGRR